MMTHRDYTLAFIIGALTGILLLPIVFILDISFSYRAPLLLLFCVIIMPVGLWLGTILQRYLGVGAQFSKYVASGLLSFAIDFSILNIISYYTGITSGFTVGWINIPGSLLALTNAYLWNKLWVFHKNDGSSIFAHLPRFLFVVLIGMIINSSVVVFIRTGVTSPHPLLTEQRWLNIAKVVATAVAVIWNFFGYKFIAFKK